jgi:tyrosyl-tRNA synthetase
MNTMDADVPRYLKAFTLMEIEETEEIVKQHTEHPELRYGQQRLAQYVTEMIFGQEAKQQAEKISKILFNTGECKNATGECKNATGECKNTTGECKNAPLVHPNNPNNETLTKMDIIANMNTEEKQALANETGNVTLTDEETRILELLVQSGLATSNGEAKKLIQSGSIFFNEKKVDDINATIKKADLINGI